jgi:hypothetical protein
MLLVQPMTATAVELVSDFLLRHALKLDAVKADPELKGMVSEDLKSLTTGVEPKEARARLRKVSDNIMSALVRLLEREIKTHGDAQPGAGNHGARLLIAILLHRGYVIRPRQRPQTPIYERSEAETRTVMATLEVRALRDLYGMTNEEAAALVASRHRTADTTHLSAQRGSHGGLRRIRKRRTKKAD